ncbi:hypothetical protein BBP40_005240 [Aspergillus hancockii]|nr:hypothetical protein BBP40_005240 [Aspergillus hancockii]
MTNPFPTTIVDLFDAWASKAPARLAAEWQGETLTYAELRTASLHMLPAVIGILRVGACYAPLDVAAWSSARVEAALAELAAPVALIATECADLTLQGVRVTVGFQKEWLRVPLQQDAAAAAAGSGGLHLAIYAVTGLDPGADIEAAAQRGIRCLLAFSIAFDGELQSLSTHDQITAENGLLRGQIQLLQIRPVWSSAL